VYSVKKKVVQYYKKILNYVSRMENITYPEQFLGYQLTGPRRPLKILLDG